MHTLMLLETATSTSITLRHSWLTHPRPLESNQIFSSVKASAHNSHSGLTITILTSTWPRLLSRLSRILWLLPLQQTRGGRFTVRYGFMLDRSAEVSHLFYTLFEASQAQSWLSWTINLWLQPSSQRLQKSRMVQQQRNDIQHTQHHWTDAQGTQLQVQDSAKVVSIALILRS